MKKIIINRYMGYRIKDNLISGSGARKEDVKG